MTEDRGTKRTEGPQEPILDVDGNSPVPQGDSASLILWLHRLHGLGFHYLFWGQGQGLCQFHQRLQWGGVEVRYGVRFSSLDSKHLSLGKAQTPGYKCPKCPPTLARSRCTRRRGIAAVTPLGVKHTTGHLGGRVVRVPAHK
jgi:hypothetical protein